MQTQNLVSTITTKGQLVLAGANKKATLKCKKIIIKTLAKLYESVYCHSTSCDLIMKLTRFVVTTYMYLVCRRHMQEADFVKKSSFK